jgi:signal transduction histidine kinase
MDEVDRLTQMINGFLDLSQIESGKSLRLNITSFDLDALLDHFVERHSLYANEHMLVYEVAEEAKGLHIEADEPRIQLVITNLVTNAIKYSPSNTTVTVRLVLEGDEARVEVEDQGFGIGESDLAKVFEPYFRTESARKKKGTGLGLPLVKKLVEHHGGRITLCSKEGEGSTFSVWLPVKHSDKEQQPAG